MRMKTFTLRNWSLPNLAHDMYLVALINVVITDNELLAVGFHLKLIPKDLIGKAKSPEKIYLQAAVKDIRSPKNLFLSDKPSEFHSTEELPRFRFFGVIVFSVY